MNLKAVAAAAAFLCTIALSGPAFAQMTAPPVNMNMQGPAMRGQHASNHNIRIEHRHLQRIIDSLEHDKHDYGGHRAKALVILRQARTELEQAIQFDRTHGGM